MPIILVLILTFYSAGSFAQFTNESELGLAAANGNTKTQTYNFKQLNTYKKEKNGFDFKSRYLNANANGVETARFFSAGLRYDRQTSDALSVFLGETYETDKFANIQNRYITDLGGKYSYINSDTTKLFSELGLRYMDEERFDGTTVTSKYVRLYNEWDKKWNANFSTKYWLELLPNLSNNNDYQINTEFSLSALLSEIFSMKSGFLIRYDKEPAPGVLYKTDTLFTTALVAKF